MSYKGYFIMNRIIVLLSDKGFQNFKFELIEDRCNIKFILITTNHCLADLDYERQENFNEIFVVDCIDTNAISDITKRIVDPKQTKKVLGNILVRYRNHKITLHSYDEMNLLFAAQLRDEFNLPGLHSKQVLPFRDKLVMKERVQQAGLRTPIFGKLEPTELKNNPSTYFKFISKFVDLPFIVKPIDSAGSEGVHTINSLHDFISMQLEHNVIYEYEEFINGNMFSVNCTSQNSKILLCGITEYLVNSKDIQDGNLNADIFLLESDPRYKLLHQFAIKALHALGCPDGSTHMELFLTDDNEIVFLEVAARFKGLLGLDAMEMNFGVNISNLTFSIESGIKCLPTSVKRSYCFDGILPKKEGIVSKLNAPNVTSQYKLYWNVNIGDKLTAAESLITNTGLFLMWNDNYEQLYNDYLTLAHYIPIEYE